MSLITIEQPTEERKKELKLPDRLQETETWSVWECAPSSFDWHYDQKEIAYLFEGKVKVKTADQEVEINKGDLVIFPQGLDCSWQVLERVRKVYLFE